MTREIAERWIAALETGNYAKGKCVMRTGPGHPDGENKYCCLGVLCEILEVPAHLDEHSQSYVYGVSEYGTPATGYLPRPVIEAAGMQTSDGRPLEGGRSLTIINDGTDSWKPVIEAIKANIDTL